MAQLALQYNDVAKCGDDVCDKSVARKLFRRLVDENKFCPHRRRSMGDFRLFPQDLRPANIIIDEDLRVVGVIDWEFAYAAPVEFIFDSLW